MIYKAIILGLVKIIIGLVVLLATIGALNGATDVDEPISAWFLAVFGLVVAGAMMFMVGDWVLAWCM